MISKKSLALEWIEEVSAKNNKADRILVEKVIRALLLLEGLASSKLDFVFKGGTALMLLIGSTKRLSIDIDIVLPNKTELELIFDEFLKDKGFIRVELHQRKALSTIEKAHYKFFYEPAFNTGSAEDHVLLDVLFEEPHYINIVNQPIDSTFLLQEGDAIKVKAPSFEDILGDKLTAFAPYTTGIPYEKGGVSRTMEIMKQLYDIGSLLDYVENLDVISETFHVFANTELRYRGVKAKAFDVLEDIYQTSMLICTRGKEGRGDIEQLLIGIKQVNNFIFSESYQIDKAITDASKAAYVAKLIEHGAKSIIKYKEIDQIRDLIIEQPFNTMLKLFSIGIKYICWKNDSLQNDWRLGSHGSPDSRFISPIT